MRGLFKLLLIAGLSLMAEAKAGPCASCAELNALSERLIANRTLDDSDEKVSEAKAKLVEEATNALEKVLKQKNPGPEAFRSVAKLLVEAVKSDDMLDVGSDLADGLRRHRQAIKTAMEDLAKEGRITRKDRQQTLFLLEASAGKETDQAE